MRAAAELKPTSSNQLSKVVIQLDELQFTDGYLIYIFLFTPDKPKPPFINYAPA